jgi:hypothetical protein
MCLLRATYEGQAQAKSLAALEGYTLPPGSGLSQELGCQGVILDGVPLVPPKQKPPGGELTPREKAANRAIASLRIRIEHASGGVKRYRMGKDQLRLLKGGIGETSMETCCGLHNFRLQYRPCYDAN